LGDFAYFGAWGKDA
jgi:hypothetical protein